jgi:hypothetical protein
MSRANNWSNDDGLVVGFGTRTVVTTGGFALDSEGPTQKVFMDIEWSDLDTALSVTSDQFVYGPTIPNGALILSATLKVTEAFASGTDIDIGVYNSAGTAVDAAGIDAAVLTAALTLGAEIACDGADVNTVVATAGGVKVGVIRTGAFDAGKAVLEVEYATPKADA